MGKSLALGRCSLGRHQERGHRHHTRVNNQTLGREIDVVRAPQHLQDVEVGLERIAEVLVEVIPDRDAAGSDVFRSRYRLQDQRYALEVSAPEAELERRFEGYQGAKLISAIEQSASWGELGVVIFLEMDQNVR